MPQITLEQIAILIELLNRVIEFMGRDATLWDALDWLQVKENAERLLAEGHEGEPKP